jgi:hypothetical protein
VQATGSSLLYSREFYRAVKRRLAPGGVLQQWLPWGDAALTGSVALALAAEFPHVRVFGSIEGWGLHFLASDRPLPARDAAALAARLPPSARADLVEWTPGRSPEELFGTVLARERPLAGVAAPGQALGPLTDERPVNEYFLLRWLTSSRRRRPRRRGRAGARAPRACGTADRRS